MVNDWSSLIRYAVIFLLFMLTYVLLFASDQKAGTFRLQSVARPFGGAVEGGNGRERRLGLGRGSGGFQMRIDVRVGLQKQVAERAKSEPAVTGRLVQAWLREGFPVSGARAKAALSGARKAAILLTILGEEAAAAICRQLSSSRRAADCG